MKGCKDGKGEGSNHRGGAGGVSGAIGVETGALFPRLHVKETKRVGPRAPPRNKMALYEQFTFPSHRFGPPPSVPLPTPGRSSGSTPYSPRVLPTGEKMALYEQFTFPSHRFAPPSGSLPSSGLPSGSSSAVLQSSSHDGSRYFCPPPYGNMGMPYMAMNVPHHVGQSFVNGSGSSTIVDGDSEMQRAQSIPGTDSGGPSSREVGHASPRHSNANARSSASKKGRGNDDCTVPIYTAPKASTGFPKVYTEGSDWFSRGPWQSGVDLTKAYQSIPVSYDYQVESSGPTSQRGECREDSVTGVTGEHRGTEVSAKIIYSERGVAQEIDLPEGLCGGAHKEKQISQIRSRYSQHTDFREYGAAQPHRRKNKQYFDDTSEAEGVRSCGTGNGECLTVLEDDEDLGGLKHRKASSKAKPMKDSEVTNSPHDHIQVVNQGLGKKQKRVESDRETYRKQSFSTECRSNTAGSSDDNVDNSGDGEVSEHTQPTLWSDSEESDATMVEAASSHKITPKDLINAVGQQGFWTARKLLQRQQMIFSSQVFELHRLIKVQQLLAAPDYGGDEDDQAAPLSPDECPLEKGQAKKTTPEKQCSGHGGDDYEKNKRVTGQQPDSTCQSSTSKRVSVQPSNPDPQCGLENAVPAPVLPCAATSGTLGAWGYPPFVKPGGSGWYGSMPAVNSPYMYQPYPGSFPQPAMHNVGAFNGSYRPVMCAPTPMDVSAMSSYGMPGYEARPDLMQDMYRYNTMQQQWQAAMYCNSVAQDPNASWYSVPPMPYMDPTQRMSSRWYEEMASSHPAAHPGFHRPTHQSSNPLLPTAQPMIYPMHPQWTEAALSQQGREGERFRAQASWPMPGGSCHSSDQGFLRPVVSSAQESAASGSQVAEGGWGKTWQGSEGKSPQDSDGQPAEVPSAPQCSTGDAQESRSHKRSRENAAEGRSSGDPERQKSSAEENNPASGRRDALPLFPLVPVSNGGEKLKSSHSFPGVIKVVPRAMVATAESAAEILLSIQKQRQQ